MIWQDEVNSFVLELHNFCQQNPLAIENDDEGYEIFQEFIEQRFDKFWPSLYTGNYRNYN